MTRLGRGQLLQCMDNLPVVPVNIVVAVFPLKAAAFVKTIRVGDLNQEYTGLENMSSV